MRSSRVFDTSASADVFTARRPSSCCFTSDESASYAAYMLANIVSPPRGGTSRASSIVRHRWALEVHGVAVPDAAEVHGLVRELRDFDDLRVAVDAADEGVLDRVADAPGEREERVRVELLVAEEHHEMREPRPADLGHRLVRDVGREVDAGDLGPERAGQGRHGNRLVRRQVVLRQARIRLSRRESDVLPCSGWRPTTRSPSR